MDLRESVDLLVLQEDLDLKEERELLDRLEI